MFNQEKQEGHNFMSSKLGGVDSVVGNVRKSSQQIGAVA